VQTPPQADQAAAPVQQPILLADDAVGKPVAIPAPAEGGGIGTEVLIVGGAALAAGAVAGGVAGKVFGGKPAQEQ
jgi:hypothetical protein